MNNPLLKIFRSLNPASHLRSDHITTNILYYCIIVLLSLYYKHIILHLHVYIPVYPRNYPVIEVLLSPFCIRTLEFRKLSCFLKIVANKWQRICPGSLDFRSNFNVFIIVYLLLHQIHIYKPQYYATYSRLKLTIKTYEME